VAFTLRGRLETRLVAALLPFLAACVVSAAVTEWWPLQLAGLMLAVGLASELAYHLLLPYQPGWLALPLGAIELAITMGLVTAFEVEAPVWAGLTFFAASWLVGQALVHAVLPFLHVTYGDDGGELGRGGRVIGALAPAALVLVLGAAWTLQPPLVRLAAGMHQGPLVLDRAQRLVGEQGAIVRGGIVVTADDVTIRDVEVQGGEHGIEVDGADDVTIERVVVSGATLDGINVRRSTVKIRDCEVQSLPSSYVQGIDISFGFDLDPSLVEDCVVTGGLEGIVTHFARVRIEDNVVKNTELRAITMTEMSMAEADGNQVSESLGVGIFCGDYSECHIEDNTITGIRRDDSSHDPSRHGVAIASHFGAKATVEDNDIHDSPGGTGAFVDASIERG
jgi:nitrous oxidase accessory protein NosD